MIGLPLAHLTKNHINYQTDKFKLTASFIDSILTLQLTDFTDWIIYTKQYTNDNVGNENLNGNGNVNGNLKGKQIHHRVILEDLFDSLLITQLENENDQQSYLREYKIGSVIEVNGVPCFKIEPHGKITIIVCLTTRAKRYYQFESILQLQKKCIMNENQIQKYKSQKQIRQIKIKYTKQIQVLKNEIKILRNQNNQLKQKLSQKQLQNINININKDKDNKNYQVTEAVNDKNIYIPTGMIQQINQDISQTKLYKVSGRRPKSLVSGDENQAIQRGLVNNNNQIQKVRQKLLVLIRSKGIQTDVSSLLQNIIFKRSINESLQILKDNMLYRKYVILEQTINGNQCKEIIENYQIITNQRPPKPEIKPNAVAAFVVKPGLILRAMCKNKSCLCYGKQVCINYGYGEFSIAKIINKCICQICNQRTEKASNFGYYQANIEIQGANDNVQHYHKRLPYSDTYVDFGKEFRQENWSYYDVKVTPS